MGDELTYATHTHHPILFYVGFTAWLVAVIAAVLHWAGFGTLWLAQVGGLVALCCSLLIGRVYITALQDRIIKLEMRLRAGRLLSAEQQVTFERLSNKQVVAVRFASDEELPQLVDRAVAESMSPAQIKKAIQRWVADHDRT